MPLNEPISMVFRMSTEDRAKLEALALDFGESAAMVLRSLVRTSYREKFGDKKPKSVKK